MAKGLEIVAKSVQEESVAAHNKGQVMKGEKMMKSFVSSENSVMPLIEQISGNSNEASRTHAALMLKKKSKY